MSGARSPEFAASIERCRAAPGGGRGLHGQRRLPASPRTALAQAIGNRAFARVAQAQAATGALARDRGGKKSATRGQATREALLQRAVLYPDAPAPARQTMDPLAEVLHGRLEFGFTAPVINGVEIHSDTNLRAQLALPAIETRDEQPIPVKRPAPGGTGVVAGRKMGWQSRLVGPVPDNTLSYQIYLPQFTRWTATFTKDEINKILARLRFHDRFADDTGTAELQMVPHPSMAAFYRHIYEHEASHAEDHIYVMGSLLGDWDEKATNVVAQGWGFEAFSEVGTERQLWSAVGTKPEALLAAIWTELGEAGSRFHHSSEGSAPRFLAAHVDDVSSRAVLTVAPPRPPGG